MKTQKTKKTKKYKYFYFGMPIPRSFFINEVPENWEEEVEDGTFSWGGYYAFEIDEDEE